MKLRGFTCRRFFPALILIILANPLFGATRYSVATGNWNSTSTWASSSGGAAGASVPGAGDNVYIERGYTVTVTVNTSCTNIIFSGVGADASLIINNSVTLTASGTITLRNVAAASNSCSVSGGGTLSCASVVLGNTDPTSASTFTHTFNSTVTNLTISGNLTINSYVGSNTNRRANGVFNLASGNVSVGGSVTTSNENAVNTSTFTMASGSQAGTLTLSGGTPFNLSGTGTNTTTLAGTSTLVNYSGGGAQTARPVPYTNLTLSGSGAKTITGTTVNGTLSIEGSATTAGTVPTYGANSTLQYKGSASQTTGIELPATFDGTGGIIINNSSGVSLNASLTITNTLTLTSGTFSVGSRTLTLNGPAIAGTPENLSTSSNSSLVFGGSSEGVNIPSSITALSGLSITNTNVIGLQSSLTVSGTFNPAGAGLSLGANTLTLNGQINCGSLTGGSSSNITVGGSGTANLSAVTVNNLTIGRAVSMCGNVTVLGTLTLSSGSFAVGSNTLTLNGPAITGTPSNLSTTASSSLAFGGSASGISVPSTVTSLNNLSIDNTNGVAINSNITLASGGTLTLTSGILGAGSFTLNVTNSAQGAIVFNPGSFVNITTGALQRALASNLSGTGNSYSFPVGESGVFKGLGLEDVNTGSTGPVLKASVSATGALTGDNTTIGPVDPRCWSLINTNGGNFTSARVELTETGLNSTRTIGMAPAAGGTYNSIGGTLSAPSIISSSTLNPGPYFCIGHAWATFYSYQSGTWSSSSTWTTDPSGTLQIGTAVPSDNDNVVILSGRTVSLAANITAQNLNVTINDGGFLDLTTFGFSNNLSSLSGQGTLRLGSVNFPSAGVNTFVNSGGGTTEYDNTSGFTLPATQAYYNNLTINCPGITATLLSSLTINGRLYIKAGTFRINDNTSTTKLTLTVTGDATVDNGAFLTVGNGVTNPLITSPGSGGTAPFLAYYQNFHTVIFNGNFTNNGTVKFTNLPAPLYNAFPPVAADATSGAATVYFQGASNNTLTCNGSTDFYNLVINKGIDQTFSLTVNSGAYSNFRLFGANSLAAESVSANPMLRKALWIYSGSLILKGNLVIPSLSEGTAANADYYIPSNGALLLDGVDVIVNSTADSYQEVNLAYSVGATDDAAIGITRGGNSALDVFGKLQLNNGYLSTKESAGLITSSTASGQIIINGGTADTKQLLSSSGSAAYTQTGGLFILRGRFQRTLSGYASISELTDFSVATLNTARAANGVNGDYASFNLENTGNIYTVSGGTITVYDVCGTGAAQQEAFDVKSSASNINVTGGSLQIIPVTGSGLADAGSFLINSGAPVSNLLVNRTSGSSTVGLSTGLIVQNSFTLTAGTLSANNNGLTIGGDVTIEAGTTYTPGNNTTTLNGTSDQVFTINLASALSLNGFTVNKPAGKNVTLGGSQNTLNIAGAFNLTLATLNDAGKTINISGFTVYNSGVHSGTGAIVLNGTVLQTIDGNGVFQNLTLNNTNGATAPVSLAANTTINGNLTFSQAKLFNIGTYNLTLNSSAAIVNGGSARYIQTAGNAGDGGVTKVYSSTASFVFHIGAPTINPVRAVKYTPASLGFNTAPSAYGSITVVPVGYEHPSTTVKGQSLTFFWRVKSSGFSGIGAGSVIHSFNYDQSDVIGAEGSYVPALYTRNDYTWRAGTNSNPPINTSTNAITDWTTPTNSTNFLDADYTAGVSAFGTPVKFYSIASAAWNLNTTWSYTSGGPAVPAGTTAGVNYPGPNSIVIIENNRTVTLNANQSCASLQIQGGSTLDIYTYSGSVFSMVLSHPSGNNGLFRLTTAVGSPKVFSFPSNSDFSDFNINHGTTEFYDIDGAVGAEYILPANVNSYGNLLLRAKGGDNLILPNNSYTTINGDLRVTGDDPDAWVTMSWLTASVYTPVVEKTVHVTGNFYIDNGTFLYLDDQQPQHLVVDGDVTIAPGAAFDTYNNYPVNNGSNTRYNSFAIGGSLINNSNSSPSARFINGSNYVNLTFTGSQNASITSTGGAAPVTILNKVTIDKGTSAATTLTCNIAGTLTTLADNWLTLLNGTLIYSRTGNFTISQGTDFTIPSTGGLSVNTPSNVYIANSATSGKTLFLNGKLTLLGGGGNVYIGPAGNTANNADIEYSGSGASAIEVQGSNLFVTGQIRRPASSTNGVLGYTQSGGSVFVYGNNNNVAKAKLEVLNSGSSFNMTGGTLTIVQGGGTIFGDLYLRPSSGSVTGGTIIFSQTPSSGPVINAVQSYQLESTIPLYNLAITGKTASTARNASLTLMISPLVLNGSLTLSNSYSILNSGNLNISIAGNMNNSGTYNYGTNTTTYNGGTQQVTGSSLTSYNNLVVSSTNSLSVNSNFTVNGSLTISTGNLILSTFRMSLLGNLTNNGSYSDNNASGGITLAGTAQQLVSGTGQFGLLDLNNAAGARIISDINLQNNLVLTQGVLDININELTLNQNSIIQGSSFGVTKMIKSDGVINCPGVKKFFTASAQSFTFPVGVAGKYTPASYNITNNGSVGFIRVNPINDNNPGVTDPSNVLKYYWQVESSGISDFDATASFKYVTGDVNGNENNYVAAWLERPANVWHKAPAGPLTDHVDETNHVITFTESSSEVITGDYTAGLYSAIPGEVPSYQTVKDGNWSDVTVWVPVGLSPPCPIGGPDGAVVIIDHTVTTDVSKIFVFSTRINGRLRVVNPTYGHNLGYVSGNGTLYLENGNLPGGNYSDFTNCSNDGTIEYGGTGTYTIIATLYDALPNISFTGSGSRVLPNKDLSVCRKLVINGPALDNSVNNRKLTLMGTMERYGTGAFISGTGEAPSATVTFGGSSAQSLGGSLGNFTGTNRFNNLEINNPAGLTIGSGGAAEVGNQLLLTNGIITTSATASLTVMNPAITAVTPEGGSSSSFISGPLTKYIVNGDAFVFPLGKGTLKGHTFTLTSAAGSTTSFTVEFFTPNSTAMSVDPPLKMTNTGEYWDVSSASVTTARIKIAWDPQSDLTPLLTTHGLSDMRVAEYLSGLWTGLTSTASGDSYYGDVETTLRISISSSPLSFTTASISGTLARAAFSPAGPVCGITSGIPVTFTSFDPITLNYTLGYTIDGVAQTPVTVTALPFTMPTPSAGSYKLTSFVYNNGSGTGVVDATTIVVYSNPTTSNAGLDKSLCGVSTTSLEGNNPSPYSGLWTIASGTGGSVVNSSQNNSVFNGILGNAYTLIWTISNGPCTSSDNVVISFPVFASIPGDFTSGSARGCRGTTGNIYTVPNVPGVIYAWTYSGTGQSIHGSGNSITVDFSSSATSGTLSVTASNNCGTSAPKSLVITVPVADFTYSGSPFCQNSPDPSPVLATDGVAGTFTSTLGLAFVSASTGQVSLSGSSSGIYNVTNTVNVAGCPLPLSATYPITIAGLTWTGAVSSNWNVAGNWSCGFVPYPTTHTVIPDVPNKPVLNSGITGSVNNLTIAPGSSLSVSGNTLRIAGDISSAASLASSGGTIELNGPAAQSIPAGIFSGNSTGNLTVNNTAGVTLLGPLNITGILKVQAGTLSSGGFLTLASTPAGTALIDGSGNGSVTGNVTMQRYLPSAYGYKYIASPFQSSAVSELADDIDLSSYFPSMYGYDESSASSGWVSYITPTDLLTPLRGFAANFGSSGLPFTADITGIVNNGPMSATLYNHNNNYSLGFNLIGNPYPSPINWDAPSGWGRSNIDNALYYFRAGITDEYSGTYSTYINGISSDGIVTSVIPSMQAFFIHVSDGAYPVTGLLSMDNRVRVTDLTHSFTKSEAGSPESILRLDARFEDDPLSSDPVVLYFSDKATPGFDSELDALKLLNTDYNVPSMYASGSDDSKLSIDALPPMADSLMTIPLGVSIDRDGILTFGLRDIGSDFSNIKISLLDTETGTEKDLANGGTYSAGLTYGEYKNRFYLNLRSSSTWVPEVPAGDNLFTVYCSHGILKFLFSLDQGKKGMLSVHNITGQLVGTKEIMYSGHYEYNPGFSDGIYIVTFTTGNQRSSKKIFYHNK